MEDMIRLAVLADVHSNLAALDACLSDAKRFNVRCYLFAGDLVSDWHQPNEVIRRIESVSEHVIRGNREEYMIGRRNGDFAGIWSRYAQFASLAWTYEALSSQDLDYLETLPAQMHIPVNDTYSIRMVHGSVFKSNELLYMRDGNAAVKPSLDAIRENILIFAHSHEQWQTTVDGKIAVNPGSVGVHFNKKRGAEYCILEFTPYSMNVIFRQVPYDLAKYAAAYCKTDLYEKAYVWFLINYLGMYTGYNYVPAFFKSIEQERKVSDLSTKGPIPNDIWYGVFEEQYSRRAMQLFLGN